MKKTAYIILAIIAAAYVIISAVKGTLNPFKWFVPKLSESDRDKCIAKNKSLADGVDCTNCPQGQGISFNGVIKNGDCIPKEFVPQKQTYKIEVTNQAGAHVYQMQGNNFTGTSTVIAFGTKRTATELITTPATYFKISEGWLSSNDVNVIQ